MCTLPLPSPPRNSFHSCLSAERTCFAEERERGEATSGGRASEALFRIASSAKTARSTATDTDRESRASCNTISLALSHCGFTAARSRYLIHSYRCSTCDYGVTDHDGGRGVAATCPPRRFLFFAIIARGRRRRKERIRQLNPCLRIFRAFSLRRGD